MTPSGNPNQTVQKTKLANGVTVLVDTDKRFTSVTLGVCLLGGLSDETEQHAGISHLLEHMLFKRTKSRSAKEIAAVMDELGGEMNAFTDFDSLCVYGTTPARQFSELSSLLAEILLEHQFDDGELSVEKEIIRQEILESQDSPSDATYQVLNTKLWPNSIFSFPVFGTLESLERITLADLHSRRNTLLRGKRCIVACCGGVDFDVVCEYAERAFGKLGAENDYTLHLPPRGNGAAFAEQAVHQTYIALSQPWVPGDSEDVAAGLIVSTILGGSLSSRLFQKLREEAGLAYEVSTSIDATSQLANLNTSSVVERNHLDAALAIIFQEMEGAAKSDITNEEFERARKLLRARYELDLDSAGNRLWYAVDHEIRIRTFNDRSHPEAVMEQLAKTTLEDVQRVASTWLLKQPGVAVLGGDIKGYTMPPSLLAFSGE